MKKKIQVTRYGIIHYHAGCNECGFTSAIQGSKHNETAEDVRNEVTKHVRKTGHTCWIESGSHTTYSLVDTPTC